MRREVSSRTLTKCYRAFGGIHAVRAWARDEDSSEAERKVSRDLRLLSAARVLVLDRNSCGSTTVCQCSCVITFSNVCIFRRG